jgi:arylsulfatase A-like enzyme
MKVICAVALALTTLISVSFAQTKPNVIIVLTDDQGYGDLSCHGNPVLKTPNLDRLHAQSIRLTDFHVSPMCTPSRGQLMTGVDALRNGAMNVSSGRTLLRREFPTMADVFAKNGYRTGIFGKWHLGDNYPYRPQDRGFQESIWFPSSHVSSAPDFWNNDYFDDVYIHNGAREPFKGYCTDVFFREAMDWMRARAQHDEPFFCCLPLNAPHAPLFVPDKFREPYRDQKKFIASFFGMIANIDENVGKLEAFLRESGLAENTIFIFMTDNGTANGESVFNAGMRGKKIDLYDGGHRVPFFIRWPNGKLRDAGDLHELTQCQDVLPTLIDLCELKKPRGAKFDGVSLAKLLRGKTDALADRMLVAQFSRMNNPRPAKNDAAVLWKKWRLVSGNELYDIAKDPGQKQNLFEKFPDVARKMQRHYDDWWKKIEARVNEFSAVHIGSPQENPAILTPCDWRDVFLDQQAQVRRTQRNGTWTLFVERDGEYEISLRRWPIEADLAITEAAPEHKGVDGIYAPGDALPIARADLKIAGMEKSKPISSSDKEVKFVLPLRRGPTDLQTWFRDADGKELCGAYYVYVNGPAKKK